MDRLSTLARHVVQYLESREGEVLDLACELVRTPSPNPPGDERAVAAVIQERLAALGLGRGEVHAERPERPNVVCRLPGGAGPGRTLLFNGHMDTKPVGDDAAHLWNTDPLTPTLRDGRLYGLGAADMKAGLAALIFAAAALAQVRDDWNGELVLACTADEEAGSRLGPGYLVANGLVQADAALLAEPCGIRSDWERMCLASRSTLAFRTRVRGTQGHSSISDVLPSVNACQKMAMILERMRTGLRISSPPHPYYPQGVTHNFGVTVQGGVFYGVVPGWAEFRTDLRLPPGTRASDAWAQVQRFVEALREEDAGLSIELVQDYPEPGQPEPRDLEIAPDHPFVRALQDAAQRVLGQCPPAGGLEGGTDAIYWQARAGIPTVPGFGPGLLPVCHAPNEWVAVRAIGQAARMYALAGLSYLKGAGP